MPNQLCFLDSNIWLYILMTDPRNTPEEEMRKRQIAIELTDNENVVISTQVINEVCSILSRKAGFNENQIREAIQEFYNGCVVVNINYETLIRASNLRSRYNFSFWDGLIVSSALEAEVSILYSEDMQDGLVIDNPIRFS
jgi:predicted nucleic acid-binding protein